MKREADLYKALKKGLGGHIYLERVENRLARGMPDVIALSPQGKVAWLELKFLRGWQHQCGTSPDQRLWLRRWTRFGGSAFLVVWIDGTVMLTSGSDILDSGSRLEWSHVAAEIFEGEIDWQKFTRLIF